MAMGVQSGLDITQEIKRHNTDSDRIKYHLKCTMISDRIETQGARTSEH